jgi:hypothetical protein
VKPWTIKGIAPEERNAAIAAAEREGLTIGEWLTRAIRTQIQADHQANRMSSIVDQQVLKNPPSEPSSSEHTDNSDKPPYGSFNWRGVPYGEMDIEYAVEKIKDVYLKYGENPDTAMQAILRSNESIVSRCGVLTTFSSMLIALSLFIVSKPEILPYTWQQWSFYAEIFIWSISTVSLLWSLKHDLPSPRKFGTEDDFKFTARLYVKRMGRYNIALLVTVVCFVTTLLLLSPIYMLDKLFHISH